MSNFMHKVKDAVSDHHDRDNPQTMNPGPNQYNSSEMGRSSGGPSSGEGSNTYDSGPAYGNEASTHRSPNVDDTRNAGGQTNAGPHDSNMANKMDPRVDSDLDNRRSYPGTAGSQNTGPQNTGQNTGSHNTGSQNTGSQNTGSQNIGGSARDFDPSSTGSIEQPRGMDNHMTSEDKYSSSKQENKSHTQPITSGNQMTSEDSYSNATQEHKTHSTTAHAEPCGMGSRAEPDPDSRMGQQDLGQQNLGQQKFGGGSTGGSSYNDNSSGARGSSGPQNPEQMNKLDPRAQGSNYQQNAVGDQRGGY